MNPSRDVFISYSRKDKEFVRKLHDELIKYRFEVWVDWEDIPPTADWRQEIRDGIDSANFLIFVISPDSMESQICFEEVEYATSRNKKLVPLLYRDFRQPKRHQSGAALDKAFAALGYDSTADDLFQRLSPHNWIFFRDEDNFDESMKILHLSLQTDLEHVKAHTRLNIKSVEWDGKDRKIDFLLRGEELDDAEEWLANSPRKVPQPTELQAQFIIASVNQRQVEQQERYEQQQREFYLQKAATNRLRYLVVALALFSVIAAILTLFALQSREEARDNAATATYALGEAEVRGTQVAQQAATSERRAVESQSLALASSAQLARPSDAPLSLALALEAINIENPSILTQRVLADLVYAPGAVREFIGHEGGVHSVVLSADGSQALSSAEDNLLILWDVATGKEVRRFVGHEGAVNQVAMTADDRYAISGGNDNLAIIWDVATGEEVHRLAGHTDWVLSVAFSPDDKLALTGSFDSTLILWDVATGEQLRQLTGHQADIRDIAFHPTRSFAVSASSDDSLILWDLEAEEGEEMLRQFRSPEPDPVFVGVSSVTFNSDGSEILSSHADTLLRLWDTDTGNILQQFSGHDDSAWDARFSPDNSQVLSGSADRTLIIWDIKTGEVMTRLAGHDGDIYSIDIAPDGRQVITASADGRVILWDVVTGDEFARYEGHSEDVISLDVSADGSKLISGAGDSSVFIWDVATGDILHRLTGHEAGVNAVAFSPDGTQALSASSDHQIIIWDVATGEEAKRLVPDEIGEDDFIGVMSAVYSPDGNFVASGGGDEAITVWNIDTGEAIQTLHGHEDVVRVVAYSPDGSQIVSGSDDELLVLWDVASGKTIQTFAGHDHWVFSAAFSPDGKQIISGSADNSLILWNVTTGQRIRQFTGHADSVRGVDFNPDGNTVISASFDQTLILWDVASAEILRRFAGHDDFVRTVVFHPDGLTAFSGAADTAIVQWRIDDTPEALITWANEHRFIPRLTCDEQVSYDLAQAGLCR